MSGVSRVSGPAFIGLGAQRSGTTWISCCLYEHPELFIPEKELHFFSRERNWKRGREWYESRFERAGPHRRAGEFSTSYLADPGTPARIHTRYPDARLICSLRSPVDRAVSNYVNDVRAGRVEARVGFEQALRDHPEYIEQGLYVDQIERYLERFAPEQMKILIYEDSLVDPLRFVRDIYAFLEVDPTFRPSSIRRRVNSARVPRMRVIDGVMHRTALALQRAGLDRLVWLIKRTGVHRGIQRLNTSSRRLVLPGPAERRRLHETHFAASTARLESLLGRRLGEWVP